MSAVFCADCQRWEPCACVPYLESRGKPAPNKGLLALTGVLGLAKFYFSSPREKKAAIEEALVRIKKIAQQGVKKPPQ